MKRTLYDYLKEYSDSEMYPFHMPGHKGSRIYRENGYGYFLDKIMDCDIREILIAVHYQSFTVWTLRK